MNMIDSVLSFLGRRSRLLAVIPVLALLAVSAAGQADRWTPTDSASDYGYKYDDLFRLITILVSVSFVIVLLMLTVSVLRDRAKPGKPASFDHGRSLHDKRFTAIVSVTVFLVLDAWVLVIAMSDLRESYYNIPPEDDPDTFQVEVLGQQWSWNFRTAGADGEMGTPDDIVTINELTVPKDRAISLNMTSKDVIHSFFLPDMRLKRDLNPGSVNLAWFRPIKAGDFDILCAELCGYAHYQMQGKLHVFEQDVFEMWEQEASRMALAGYDAEDTEAEWAWDWRSQG